jgi:signal transduction histidine kinase
MAKAPETSGASPRARAETILRVTDRLKRLTRDLTDFALLDGGRLSLVTAPFDPNEVIEAAAAELVPLASEKSILIRMERSSPVVYGRGDRARLLQVLVNLGGNAVKFAPPGSTITLAASVLPQSFSFSVGDEGPGIPPSLRERVFRAGVRAARGDGGGTGLGLAIARTVVELMRGTIHVEQVEPRGARFVFEVPRVVSAG